MQEESRYSKIDYRGNWNIGAFGVATDSFAILDRGFRKEMVNKARKALKIPIIIQDFLLQSLIGSMLLANSHGILLPEKQVDQKDLETLEETLEQKDVNVAINQVNLKRYYNALGNLALCLDDIIIFHSEIVEQNKELIPTIEETMKAKVAGFDFQIDVPGSALVGGKKGILADPLIDDDILKDISRKADVRVGRGSVNFGSPWVGNGLILNSNGFLAGNKTTGYEMAQIWRILYKE